MKISLGLITKHENVYLEEWLLHHHKIGVDHFYIYDNENEESITTLIDNLCSDAFPISRERITVIYWDQKDVQSQMNAYKHCCSICDADYIGFLDTDEFYFSTTMNIKKDFKTLQSEFGLFDGIGFYWRMYGSNPYFTERHPMSDYTQWYKNDHIRSFIKPKKIQNFPDPHKAVLIKNTKYIDELGRTVSGPIGKHTSTMDTQFI